MRSNGRYGTSGIDAEEKTTSDIIQILLNQSMQNSVQTCNQNCHRRTKLLEFKQRLLSYCTQKMPSGSIDIGEVLRRTIGRSIVKCVKINLQLVGGKVQMCLGQKTSIGHAIHALHRQYLENRTEVIPPIDNENAFNSFNRDLALKTSVLSRNLSFSTQSVFFIDKRVIKFQEGTTQDDPITMAIYGLAILLLINMLEVQKSDDGNVPGSLESLRIVLDKLKEHVGAFSYNVIKCHFIKNPESAQEANKTFPALDVDVINVHRVRCSVHRVQ